MGIVYDYCLNLANEEQGPGLTATREVQGRVRIHHLNIYVSLSIFDPHDVESLNVLCFELCDLTLGGFIRVRHTYEKSTRRGYMRATMKRKKRK